jgi:hypothetical protein
MARKRWNPSRQLPADSLDSPLAVAIGLPRPDVDLPQETRARSGAFVQSHRLGSQSRVARCSGWVTPAPRGTGTRPTAKHATSEKNSSAGLVTSGTKCGIVGSRPRRVEQARGSDGGIGGEPEAAGLLSAPPSWRRFRDPLAGIACGGRAPEMTAMGEDERCELVRGDRSDVQVVVRPLLA